MNNVSALIKANKTVRADLDQNYKGPNGEPGPHQDGMWATGMLIELLKLGFVIVPQKDWAEALGSKAFRHIPLGGGGMSDEEYERLIDRDGYVWTPDDERRLRETVERLQK